MPMDMIVAKRAMDAKYYGNRVLQKSKTTQTDLVHSTAVVPDLNSASNLPREVPTSSSSHSFMVDTPQPACPLVANIPDTILFFDE